MKPEFLYHGSVRIVRGKFTPRVAKDLDDNPDNIHKAVYATDIKEVAISMAIISCKGVGSSNLNFKKAPYGKIIDGEPKQKYIYLYIFPANKFKQLGGDGRQWACFDPIKPLSVEKLAVSDYMHLIKRATPAEVKRWYKKYAYKIPKKD
jgi:hypothetical protein